MIDVLAIVKPSPGRYFDPETWLKIEPLIREELVRKLGYMATGTAKSESQYKYEAGYIQALDWVLKLPMNLQEDNKK